MAQPAIGAQLASFTPVFGGDEVRAAAKPFSNSRRLGAEEPGSVEGARYQNAGMGMLSNRGITLLEILMVVAVLGVLLSISPMLLPRESFAVRQEAQSISRLVEWSRFEAVRRNAHVGVRVSGANSHLEVYEYEPLSGTEVWIREHDVEGFGVDIAAVSGYPMLFDTRGLRDPITGFGLASIQLTSGSHTTFVCVNAQGKATTQKMSCS